MLRPHAAALAVALVAPTLVSGLAAAAGFEIPDNGAAVIARGGTAVTMLGTSYGLQFNPAGIAFQEGLDVRLDARLVNHASTFERASVGSSSFVAVENLAGPFVGPFITASYASPKLLGGKLGFGVGVFGPPGVGKYAYADPEALKAAGAEPVEVNGRTGQRYTLIDSAITILYPSVAVAYRPLPWLSVGVTFQSAYSNVKLRQTMAAASLGRSESFDADAVVQLDVTDSFTPTGVLGVAARPTKEWSFGASFRPTISLANAGSLVVKLPDIATRQGFSVVGDKADLALKLPPLARLGAAYAQERWSAAAELVYEGWHVADKFVLTPHVSIKRGANAEPEPLEPIDLPKEWKDSFGARLGGSFDVVPGGKEALGVKLHAGALFESNAIPTKRQAIDYVTGNRFGLGLGATASRGPFALTVSAMAYAPVAFEVTDSLNARAVAEPEEPPIIIGNGAYTSNIWIASVGLAYAAGLQELP